MSKQKLILSEPRKYEWYFLTFSIQFFREYLLWIWNIINKTIALYLFARWPQHTRQLSYFYYLFSPVDIMLHFFYFQPALQIFVYWDSVNHKNTCIQSVSLCLVNANLYLFHSLFFAILSIHTSLPITTGHTK